MSIDGISLISNINTDNKSTVENSKKTKNGSIFERALNKQVKTSGSQTRQELEQLIEQYHIEDFTKIFHLDYTNSYNKDSEINKIIEIIKECVKKCKAENNGSLENLNTILKAAGNEYFLQSSSVKYDLNREYLFNEKLGFKTEYLEKAISQVQEDIKEGKIDQNNKRAVSKKIREYIIAQNCRWSIEKYNASCNDKTRSSNIRERLAAGKSPKEIKKIKNADAATLTKMTEQLFKSILAGLYNDKKGLSEYLKKLNIDEASLTSQEYKELQQKYVDTNFIQTIGKLLIGTAKKQDREAIIGAIKALKGEYKSIGMSCTAAYIKDNEEIKNPDKMSPEDVKEKEMLYEIGDAILAENIKDIKTDKKLSPQDVAHLRQEITDAAKLAHLSTVLHVQEQELKELIQKYITGNDYETNVNLAGAINAAIYARNDKTEEESKKSAENIKLLDAYEPLKRQVLHVTKEVADVYYTPEQQKYITISLDKVTNGNYSKIAANPDCELNPPVKEETLKSENNGIGIKNSVNTDVSVIEESRNNAANIQQTIKTQTEKANPKQAIVIESGKDNTSSQDDASSENKFSFINNLYQNLPEVTVKDIRDFSISLSPLLKEFSNLKQSVQNHIRLRLEAESEDEQVQHIAQIDRNSEKAKLAVELGISADKLDELDLDSCSRERFDAKERDNATLA